MDNAHDKRFKLVHGCPQHAAAYFEFLPAPIVARLELSALKLVPGSFVDDALEDRHMDLLYLGRSELTGWSAFRVAVVAFAAFFGLGFLARAIRGFVQRRRFDRLAAAERESPED